MSYLEQSQWKQWAQEWGFIHSPQKAWNYPNEWMAGAWQGRLVKLGWGGDRGRRLYVMIRYPMIEGADVLRENLRRDDELAALPGWKKIKPERPQKAPAAAGTKLAPEGLDFNRPTFSWSGLTLPDLVVAERGLVWSHEFAWRRPKPAQVRQWVDKLVGAVSRWTVPFQGRCEECTTSRADRFVLFEGVPVFMCSGCRERHAAQGQMAQQRYEMEDANYTLGLVYAAIAAIVGGGMWALLAIWTQRMYALVAMGIGLLVAFCYKLGARKLDRMGQVLGAALTLAGVIFGDVVFYAYMLSKTRPDIGFRLDAGVFAFIGMLKESPGDIIFSLVFGALGAWVAVRWLGKPRFTPKIQSAEEAAGGMKKAA